jgi:sulfate permease, SulP family
MSQNQDENYSFIDRSDLLPKFFTYLQRGFSFDNLRADFLAGLTVAIVALPLSMAIAIASNTSPDVGLKTAFVAGFWISVLGGSRFQIGGPTAAFSIVVANIIAKFGMDGLIIATFMAGAILMAAAAMRLGALLKFVPQTVVIGFTAGIAVTIFISQIAAFFGLDIQGKPIEIIEKLAAIIHALPTLNIWTTAVSIFSLLVILIVRRLKPKYPYFLIVVILSAIIVWALKIDAQTVGDKFGVLKTTIPQIIFPKLDLGTIFALLPSALTIAFLAGIESLLSAVVADGMTGGKHRPNAELLGQGFANLMSAITGGLPATGAIARTATNIRAGAFSPLAGALHATLLLIILLVAGKLTSFIPLATLSAILMVVAWNMAEFDRVIRVFKFSDNQDRLVLATTFILTIFADLTIAVEAGVMLSAVLFMKAMSDNVGFDENNEDAIGQLRKKLPKDVEAFRLNGPLFFGAVSAFVEALESMRAQPKALILNMASVTYIDSSGIVALLDVINKLRRAKIRLIISELRPNVQRQFAIVRKVEGQLEGVYFVANDDVAIDLIAKMPSV